MSGALARRWDHLRTSRIVLTGLWADAVLVMAASAWNGGLAFEALGQHLGEGIALGVAVDVGLAVSLIGDRALHLHGRSSGWGRALRVITAVMSLCLNCGVQLWLGHYGVAAFHAFLPILLVLLSEYAQDTTLQFGEIAEEHTAEQQAQRDAELAADRERWEAQQAERGSTTPVATSPAVPIGPPAAPAFQAGPGRPAFAAAVRPADRPAEHSADRTADRAHGSTRTAPPERPAPTRPNRSASTTRNGPARKRTGKPKTDVQLSAAVRDLAKQHGGPPSQYAVKQALGVGSGRAARLLAELTTTPVGPPSTNGAATRKESAR
ncbi:MAG TPA: hypothetical protein VHH34_00410 [Pseudonocardiaceae bacterium]|nr:hypothetical protein [Pseudonocardiaceae bacterium]